MTPRSSLPELAKIKTAGWYRCFSEAAVLLKEEYSELRAVDQRRVESALTDLREGQLINSMPLMFAQQSRTRSTTLKEFVNPDGTPKHLQTLSHLIRRTVRKHAGVDLAPHQLRHLAAKIVLDDSPGAFELVKQLLGHENLKTTTNSYAGIDTRRAARHHHRLLERETEKKPTPFGRLARKRKVDRSN
jgi:integrase